ncbi:MAG: hypothetical protein NZ555_02840 [Geminicoccaceae bacterium]|nr:hypothetical protein [Geminicoccaceae bacterium]MCX8100597.1 hypothetical protein [Geminicoccaceae bacterium]MDW8371820.1 hypothetical protein [Geminicoccaceae bacterium]
MTRPAPDARPSLSEIARIVRDDDPEKLAQILATGATIAEIEKAVLWASGAEDVLGEAPHPLEGAAARVYDILTADAPDEDERR